MTLEKDHYYFATAEAWRDWLEKNHDKESRAYLIFYKVSSSQPSMRWEEAVKVAICYGWIDSTVKKIDEERRRQLFTPRKAKSVWSKLNKSYIEELEAQDLLHESGKKIIALAKENGSWESLDAVENLEIPTDLKAAFDANEKAHSHFTQFSKTYRKGYLYWLNQAKRPETRENRIAEIVRLCEQNIKSRGNF